MPRNSLRTLKILPVCRAGDGEVRAEAGTWQRIAKSAASAARQSTDIRSRSPCQLPVVDFRSDLAFLGTVPLLGSSRSILLSHNLRSDSGHGLRGRVLVDDDMRIHHQHADGAGPPLLQLAIALFWTITPAMACVLPVATMTPAELASEGVEQVKAELEAKKREVTAQVRKTFYDLLRNQEELLLPSELQQRFGRTRNCCSVRNPRRNSSFERLLDLFFNLQNLIRRHVPQHLAYAARPCDLEFAHNS